MQFLKADLIIQKLLGAIYVTLGLLGIAVPSFLMLAMLTQLAIGSWQVLSALTFAVFNKEKKRVIYLIAVVCYFALLFISVQLLDSLGIRPGEVLFIVGVVIIPMSFAVWYFIITRKHLKALLENSQRNRLDDDMEDVLDSGELGMRDEE